MACFGHVRLSATSKLAPYTNEFIPAVLLLGLVLLLLRSIPEEEEDEQEQE